MRVGGPQTTKANSGGNGHMEGVMSFTLSPTAAAGGAAPPPITGTIDYGTTDPSSAIQISNGNAVDGVYVTAIDGGGTARVPPQTAPSPSVSECLGLP